MTEIKKLTGIFIIIIALFFAVQAGTAAVGYKKLQRDAGKTMAVVTRISTDRVLSATGRFNTVRKAHLEYTVGDEPYSASISVSGTATHEGDKMLIYYDKNAPDKMLNTPTGVKQGLILAAILFATGAAMCVWMKNTD